MSTEDGPHSAELERVQQAIRDLGPVHADPAFRSRLRLRFVTGGIAADGAAADRRGLFGRLRSWMLVPAAAAAAAGIWLLVVTAGPAWEFRHATGTGTIAVSAQEGAEVEVGARDTARLAGLIRPGAHIRMPENSTLDLIAGNVLLFQIDAQAVLTVPGTPRKGEGMVSRLEAGELRIRTGPGFTGHRLSVRTTEGRTELSGTVVSVFKGGDFTCVCVLEGTARIGRSDATLEDVPAGMRKVMFADERPSMVVAIEPHHLEGLTAFVEQSRGVFE
jgi:ferric-dicitrate binding protein FerR (iron transport regulator)